MNAPAEGARDTAAGPPDDAEERARSTSALRRARLYGILDAGYCLPENMPEMLRRMIAGGIDIVQLRAKHLAPERLLTLAKQLHPQTRAAGIPMVINDHPDVAGAAGVEAVHLGQDDVSVAEARRIVGRSVLIGKSTHSLPQAVAAEAEGADYIGFGPLFSTPTKPDYPAIGKGDIQNVHDRIGIPVFCIGGIKRENLREVMAAGARRVVIVSGILQAADPEAYVRECVAACSQWPMVA